jgi:diacylglycerol kinase (ATP)
MFSNIHIVINPAAGRGRPILSILNSVFGPAGVEWHVHVTKGDGDAGRLTRLALERGADVVAAYGGDGTVREVGAALRGSDVPLAIFPGGTANVMSYELGISNDLAEASALVCGEDAARVRIDMGRSAEHGLFILRVGAGLEAEMVGGASREAKDRIGTLAYAVSALQALRNPTVSRYRLELDGKQVEAEGITCMVCNSGHLGLTDLTLSPIISVNDGLLDVIVLEEPTLPSAVSMLRDVLNDDEPRNRVQHWQAAHVVVEADPAVDAQGDGEMWGKTPLEIEVLPSAVEVVVPRTASIAKTTDHDDR